MRNRVGVIFRMLGLFLTLGGVTFTASASEPEVEITSFLAAGSRTNAAELCGKVLEQRNIWTVVRVVVDPQTKRPGIYNALVGSDARFCITVVSFSGRAEASIGPEIGSEQVSTPAVIGNRTQR